MAVFSVNNSNNRFTLRLTLTEGAYDVANNTSPVTYKLELIANTAYNFSSYGIGRKIVLGGTTVYEGARKQGEFSIADYGTLTLASGTHTVTHDADGSKSLSVAYSIDMAEASYTPGSLSGTGTMTMVQIPRQATLVSAPDFTDEENPTITYSNPAGSAVTSLRACISLDGSTDDIAYRSLGRSATSYTFTLTDEERNVLRNATTTSNTRTVKFFVRTVIGGATYLSYLDKTLSIVNANPTFTEDQASYKDVSSSVVAVTGNNQHIVQDKSSLTATFGAATGNKGAKIKEYTLTLNGVTKTATASGSVSFGAVNSGKNVTLSVTAKDSRGNTTTVNKTVTVLAWSPPVVSATVERLNNYEDETYLTAQVSISSVNSKNTVDITYKCKQSGGSFGDETPINNRKKYTISCDKDYAYVFSITATDKFGSTTKEYDLPKGKFPLFIDTEKNAVGINEFPKTGEALRVAGNATFENSINGAYILRFRVDGTNTFTIKTRYGEFAGKGQSRQTVSVFGCDNWTIIRGAMVVGDNGTCKWDGTSGVAVEPSETAGAVTVTLPTTAYDEFVLMSPNPISRV